MKVGEIYKDSYVKNFVYKILKINNDETCDIHIMCSPLSNTNSTWKSRHLSYMTGDIKISKEELEEIKAGLL